MARMTKVTGMTRVGCKTPGCEIPWLKDTWL